MSRGCVDGQSENTVELVSGDTLGLFEMPQGHWWLHVTDGESGEDRLRIYGVKPAQLATLYLQIEKRLGLSPAFPANRLWQLYAALDRAVAADKAERTVVHPPAARPSPRHMK